jgi:hypothetical protein
MPLKHGLSECEFTVTLENAKHVLNTDLAQHGLSKTVLSIWC